MSPKNTYIEKVKTLFLANFVIDIYSNFTQVLGFLSFLEIFLSLKNLQTKICPNHCYIFIKMWGFCVSGYGEYQVFPIPADTYLIKVNNGNVRAMCEIC